MLKRLFLLAVFAGMVMGLGACGITAHLDQIALMDKTNQTLFNQALQKKEGKPVVLVVKNEMVKPTISGLTGKPGFLPSLNGKRDQSEATGEMIIPYLARALPNARFVLTDDKTRRPEDGEVAVMLVDQYMKVKFGPRFNTHLAYKVTLPDGEERVFRAEATKANWISYKRTYHYTLNKCLTKIAGDIAKWLVEKGIVSPSEVNLAQKR